MEIYLNTASKSRVYYISEKRYGEESLFSLTDKIVDLIDANNYPNLVIEIAGDAEEISKFKEDIKQFENLWRIVGQDINGADILQSHFLPNVFILLKDYGIPAQWTKYTGYTYTSTSGQSNNSTRTAISELPLIETDGE